MTEPDLSDISAAIRDGNWAEVEQRAQSRLATQPEREDMMATLAISLQMQGKAPQAVDAYARLTRLFPHNSVYWGNYATSLRETGALSEAAEAHAAALRLTPDDIDELVNFGLLQLQQRDYRASRATMLKAWSLDPDSPRVRIHAARACDASREYDEAERLLAPWRQWIPLEDDLQLELGDLLLSSGDGRDALVVLEDLARRDPANVSALAHLASAYERLNRLPDAEATLARIRATGRALSEASTLEIAHVVAKIAQRNGDLKEARAILEGAGPRSEGDFAHYFSLAEVHSRQGHVDLAMQALQAAHELQAMELRKSVPGRFEPGASVLPAADRRGEAAEFQRWPQLKAPDARESPVFIVGFPRSGTTLLEQMLDAHPGLQSMDENPFFNKLTEQLADHGLQVPSDIPKLSQRDCDELRRRYLSMVCDTIARKWDAQLVDKNPLNMLWLPLIHRLFPNARFVLALRHPCDVILSCYMQNFRANVLASVCTDLQRLATAYVASMNSWLHHSTLFGTNALNVRNEDVIADPQRQAERIAGFLGLADPSPLLQFHTHAREKGFIGTPSYTQVIQPVNDKGMNRWLRYRAYLDPVLPTLEPMLRHWGYSTDAEAAQA